MLLAWILRNWKLVAIAAALVCLAAGVWWFRGVLADNAKLTAQNGAQAAELAAVNGEIERMNRLDASDYALRQNIEAQKKILANDLATSLRNLKKAKDALDEATRNCMDMPLPQSYLDRLPLPPTARDKGQDAGPS